MLRLSINLLSNAIALLSEVKSKNIRSSTNMLNEKAFYYWAFSVDKDALLDLSITCGWIISEGNNLILTDRGNEILYLESYGVTSDQLRLMLKDYVNRSKPVWRNRIPYGRKEATIFMNKDEKACFQEAGLLTVEPSKEEVLWWDRIADTIRAEKQQELLAVGRSGEEYTLEYERIRTNAQPRWISIDSNMSGYDIISRVSVKNSEMLLIEVKSSSAEMESAFLHISRNEWNAALSSRHYLFYLWLLLPHKRLLATISPQVIKDYIPVDQLSGEWENVSIPFKDFSSFFSETK